MVSSYETPQEQALHSSAIETLAQELHAPVEKVASLYERRYFELKSQAKVREYLGLFASRHVRDRLRA